MSIAPRFSSFLTSTACSAWKITCQLGKLTSEGQIQPLQESLHVALEWVGGRGVETKKRENRMTSSNQVFTCVPPSDTRVFLILPFLWKRRMFPVWADWRVHGGVGGVGLLSRRLVLLKQIPHISIKQQLCFGTALKTDPGGHWCLGVCGRLEAATLSPVCLFLFDLKEATHLIGSAASLKK